MQIRNLALATFLFVPAVVAGGSSGCGGPWTEDINEWVQIDEYHVNTCADTDGDGVDGPGERMHLTGEQHVMYKARECDDGEWELNLSINHGKVVAVGEITGDEYNSNGVFNIRGRVIPDETNNAVFICHFVESGQDGKNDYLYHGNFHYTYETVSETDVNENPDTHVGTYGRVVIEQMNQFWKCPGSRNGNSQTNIL